MAERGLLDFTNDGWDRDMILPFARRMRDGHPVRGGGLMGSDWHFAVPQFAADVGNAATAMHANVFGGRPVSTEEMIGHAGSVVGPMVAGGMGRAMMSPAGASELGIFGGRLAKTADHAALVRAEQMAAQGVPREQIWADTGWFQGVDGKWRFEIDDSGARLRADNADFVPAREVYQHQGLFEAYPRLGDIEVFEAASSSSGYSRPVDAVDPGAIRVGRYGGSPNRIAAHEFQHAVQDAEGFAMGGNFKTDRNYNDLAGEVEARAAAKRVYLKPDQRRARPPWLDYDVPETDQIVRFAR